MPKASIIIRTYNEEKHIGNLLLSIIKQKYKNYEIIIVDSGSVDRTLEIAGEFPVKIIKIENRDFTFGYALNVGCKASTGRYLVFVSAHVIPVDNNWLSGLLAPFGDENVAMVYGRQMGNSESKFSERMDFKRLFGPMTVNSNVPINYANNANSAIRKDLWKKRQFDEYLFGLEDIEWAKYITKKGYFIRYEPEAAIYHIHTEKWHQVFNRYRREAIAAVRIGLDHPPQAKLGIMWLFINLFLDLLNSLPNISPSRLEEILRFRYYQWKGSRQGWFRDRDLDLNREKINIFFPIKNQSVVIKDKNKAEFEDVELEKMQPGDILIKVDYVGICRTDLEVLDGTLGYYRDGIAHYPITPGHEFSGTIERIGANNKFRERFKVGQKIVGECILSRGGTVGRKEVGVINHNGAYSRYVVMPGDAVHVIPPEMDSKTAAMAEPLAVVLRAIRRIKNRLSPKTTVAVIGAGPIGNLCAQVLSLEGYKVSVFDRNEERLRLLKNNVHNTNTILEQLNKFDVIIEATGSKEILERVIKESGNNCTLLLLGFPYGVVEYNFEDLSGYEKVFIGSVGGDSEDFDMALELLPKLDMGPFIEKVMPLTEFKNAWDLHRTSKFLKIILKP